MLEVRPYEQGLSTMGFPLTRLKSKVNKLKHFFLGNADGDGDVMMRMGMMFILMLLMMVFFNP